MVQLFTVDGPGGEGDMSAFVDVSDDDLEPTFDFPEEPSDDERPQTTSGSSLWQDPSDKQATVSLLANKRMRKLARGKANEDRVSGEDLQNKLREQ